MRNGIYAALIAACIALAGAAPASAQKHQHRMTFDFAVMVARDYWAMRGVAIPCHPQEQLLTYANAKAEGLGFADADMLTDAGMCTITIMPWAESWRADRDLDQNYCWEIVHEVGHVAGLEHPGTPAFDRLPPELQAMLPDTVMNTDGAPYPYGCTHPHRFLRAHAARVELARTSRLGPLR